MKLRASTMRNSKKKLKTLSSVPWVNFSTDFPRGRFGLILELDFASIWNYLNDADVCVLLEACSSVLSNEFVTTMSLKAIDKFCEENMTHLGRQCGCDWMRSLAFTPLSDDACTVKAPYVVEKTLPILQVPGGARALLSALFQTKKLIEPARTRRSGRSMFVPVICPLVTEDNLSLCPCAAKDVKHVMSRICPKTGARFFHEYQKKRGRSLLDYLDHHWHGIVRSSCEYCESLTRPQRDFRDHTLQRVARLRTNCTEVYRPLKAAMMTDLQLVRFVPRPRGLRAMNSTLHPGTYYGPYQGLAAGITKDGVVCGVYLVDGFNALH